MRHKKPYPFPNNHQAAALQSNGSSESNQLQTDVAPAPDAVARKAYLAYLEEGSPSGREVQHWLKAEAELLAEGRLARVHASRNNT